MASQRKSYLLRHISISVLILWVLILVGIVIAAPLAMHLSLFKPDLNGHTLKAVAEMLEASRGSRAPEEVIEHMNTRPEESAGDVFIADNLGRIIANSSGTAPDFQLDPSLLPKILLQVSPLNGHSPTPGDPAILRLSGEPARFLIFRPMRRIGPEQFMMVAIVCLVTLLVVVAMSGSSYILLRKLRGHAREAETVMMKVQQGDLKARLAISRPDEFGAMMALFNHMADEIERLFIRVRETERLRVHLLQDIGHDLRTPLSSLLNIFDLLAGKFEHITAPERLEYLLSGRREVKFTQHLVEDLLFLARVEDPACRRQDETFDLSELVQSVVEAKRLATSLEIHCNTPASFMVFGDPQLLKRLFRNALDNSISYALNSIQVRVQMHPETVEIQIDDDGPGFSNVAKESFGQKRPTRIQHSSHEARVSMGLGSVIMVAIARLYRGSVQPSNRLDGEKVVGGRVSICLDLKAGESNEAEAA